MENRILVCTNLLVFFSFQIVPSGRKLYDARVERQPKKIPIFGGVDTLLHPVIPAPSQFLKSSTSSFLSPRRHWRIVSPYYCRLYWYLLWKCECPPSCLLTTDKLLVEKTVTDDYYPTVTISWSDLIQVRILLAVILGIFLINVIVVHNLNIRIYILLFLFFFKCIFHYWEHTCRCIFLFF